MCAWIHVNKYTIKGVQKIIENNSNIDVCEIKTDYNNKDNDELKTLFINEINLLEVKKLLIDFEKLIEKI